MTDQTFPQKKSKNRIYRHKNDKYTEFLNVSMICSAEMFHNPTPNNHQLNSPKGVHDLLWNYHLTFKPILLQCKCVISCKNFAYKSCKNHFESTWIPTLCDDKTPRYCLSLYCVHSNLLGGFNKLSIIIFTKKDTYEKDF